MKNDSIPFKTVIAWLFIVSAYVLAFMQRMAPQSINSALATEFTLTTVGVSWLTAAYFWGYTAMQIPAGPLVDMHGVRRTAIASMLVSAIGTTGFAASPNMLTALIFRLLVATGDALVFTILIKLVSRSFSDNKFGLMSGLSQASGYLGGALATAPLAFFVSSTGWRGTFFTIAIIACFNLTGVILFLKEKRNLGQANTKFSDILATIKAHLKNIPSWGCAIANSSHFILVSILAGVWGLPMIAHTFHIDYVQAGTPLALFMAGNIIGSIFIGSVTDKFSSATTPLALIYTIRLALITLLAPDIARHLGYNFLLLNFLAIGILSGGAVPAILKCVKKIYTPQYMGTGASLSMTCAGIATAALLPLLGVGMRFAADQNTSILPEAHALNDSSFIVFIVFLVIISIAGLFGLLLIKKGENPASRALQGQAEPDTTAQS